MMSVFSYCIYICLCLAEKSMPIKGVLQYSCLLSIFCSMISQAHSVAHLIVYMITAKSEWTWNLIGMCNFIFYKWNIEWVKFLVHIVSLNFAIGWELKSSLKHNQDHFPMPSILAPFWLEHRLWACNSYICGKMGKMVQSAVFHTTTFL